MILHSKRLTKYCAVIVLLSLFISDAKGEEGEDFHYRSLYPGRMIVKFSTVPADLPLITHFPLEELKQHSFIKDSSLYQSRNSNAYIIQFDSGKGVKGALKLDFYVHTSVEAAEDFLAERRHGDSGYHQFSLDLPEPIEIGDNCWVTKGNKQIEFIRNNIVLYINRIPDDYGDHSDDDKLEFAYLLDELLQKCKTVNDSNLMPAPVIDSLELLNGPFEPDKYMDFEVTAHDPQGKNLIYRLYRNIWSLWNTKSLVHFLDDRYVPSGKMKIWVMNEDKIVSSIEYLFPPPWWTFLEDDDDFHYIRPYPKSRPVKFKNVPADLPLITHFPLDVIKEHSFITNCEAFQDYNLTNYIIDYNSGQGIEGSLMLEYYVHSSVKNAEEYVTDKLQVETIEFLSQDLQEPIDLGDNCWIGSEITFIRNNVVVLIKKHNKENHINKPETILEFAFMLDDILLTSETVNDSKLMPAPVIDSIVLTNEPLKIYNYNELMISAHDPQGSDLVYRFYTRSWSWSSKNLWNYFVDPYYTPEKIKVWVMNEDKVVSSIEYLLPLEIVSVNDLSDRPEQFFNLAQNAPNPFNQATMLSFELYHPGELTLTIYDVLGRKIAEVKNGWLEAGMHRELWNGCDENGKPVSSGVYFYHIQSHGMVKAGRMMVLR